MEQSMTVSSNSPSLFSDGDATELVCPFLFKHEMPGNTDSVAHL